MSAGGLIARMALGGAEAVGTGIGNRIREEAKLKRQQALEKTKTTETMKRQAHGEALKRGTNEQTDRQARGRMELQDELNQETYSDVTDDQGNLIGQRNDESNQYTPFTSKGNTKMPERERLAIESLNSEIESIYSSAEAMGGALTEDQQNRIDALTAQRNAMLYGGGSGTVLSNLMAGEGGSGTQPSAGSGEPAAEEKPQNVRGLLQGAMENGEKAKKGNDVKAQVDALESEADELLDRLKPRPTSGVGGRPNGNKKPERSPEDIAAAQELVQRLIALDENPETSAALSDRQRQNIVQRIMELQRAGVPINLDPKQ